MLNLWIKKILENRIVVLGAIPTVLLVFCVGIWISTWNNAKDTIGTENPQASEYGATEEVFATETVQETEETELEEIQTISVSMTATSMEKDLKIKIVDESKSLIAGQPFVIMVTPEGGTSGQEYNDHDMDGIIYINSIAAGTYIVQLQELEGFVITENPISAIVKDKIVYEKVEIENEIRDESEIDASKEDTAKKEEEVENQIKDTLPLLQSEVLTDEVKKDQVDISLFPEAEISKEKDSFVIDGLNVALSKEVILYTCGKETAKQVELSLELEDETGIIKDITWKIVDTDAGDTVSLKVSEDKKSAVLTAEEAGQAKVVVEISYESEDETESEDTTESEGETGSEDESESEDTTGTEDGSESGDEPKSGINNSAAKVQLQTHALSCTVRVTDPSDDKTQLKDVKGNLLFLDTDAKTIATPKSFSAAEKFYANPRYTGWQTIDGKLYYYKEDHTYATGKQVIGGVGYEFDDTGYLVEKKEAVGIDVSKWQGDIDWKAVAGAGIDFAIIRCGYRGSSTGTLIEDPYFKQNIAGATANGIKVGVYFYSQAITEAEAVEEASMALELVKGYHLQLPLFVDTEGSGGRGDNISKGDRTKFLIAFCETVKNAGYKPGVYSGRYWYTNKVNVAELEKYHIWVAQYNTECTYTGRYDIWQYTDSGNVPGIKGAVDMNISYRTYY